MGKATEACTRTGSFQEHLSKCRVSVLDDGLDIKEKDNRRESRKTHKVLFQQLSGQWCHLLCQND